MDKDKQSTNSMPAMDAGSLGVSSSPDNPNTNTGQQAIFSTPTAPTTPQPQGGAAHPFFANHPSQTFNTDAGDIVIGGGQAKKPKRSKVPIIVGAIALVAVLTVVIIMVVMMSDGSSSKTNTTSKVNKFANYLLYGQESSAVPSDDCKNNTNCPFDEILYVRGSEESAAYLERAQELWEEAKGSLTNIDNAYVDEMTSGLDSLVAYAKGEGMTGELSDLWMIYSEIIDMAEAAPEEEQGQYYVAAAEVRWEVTQAVFSKKDEIKNLCYKLIEEANA